MSFIHGFLLLLLWTTCCYGRGEVIYAINAGIIEIQL